MLSWDYLLHLMETKRENNKASLVTPTQTSVTGVILLGIEKNDKLTFNVHIEKICRKLLQCMAVLQKIKSFPSQQRQLLYNANVRPVLDFVKVIWSNCGCYEKLSKFSSRTFRRTI